jgi:hypothetical protein
MVYASIFTVLLASGASFLVVSISCEEKLSVKPDPENPAVIRHTLLVRIESSRCSKFCFNGIVVLTGRSFQKKTEFLQRLDAGSQTNCLLRIQSF